MLNLKLPSSLLWTAAALILLAASLETSSEVAAQITRTPSPQPGGVATGAPLNYSTRRTVGITDPRAPVIFEDVTDSTVLAKFIHRSGTAAKDYILEAPSGSLAIFDYDNDGRPD